MLNKLYPPENQGVDMKIKAIFKAAFALRFLLMLLLLAVPAVVQAQNAYSTNTDGSIYTYSTNTDGSVTIVGYAGPPWAVVIPTNINGLTVTSIGVDAFFASSTITSVTIGTNVTDIGNSAFYACSSLTNVIIGSSVTNIEDYAFQYCGSLTAITVVTNNPAFSSVAGVLFNNNQTTLVQYPPGETGSYTIPNSVINIGDNAFATCSGLTNVTIGNSVANIGIAAFQYCGLTSVTIPNSVTSIGDFAFDNCTSLTSVMMGNGVNNIPDDAFAYCSKLSSVTIGRSITSIGSYAFGCCLRLTAIYFQGNAPSLGSYVFQADSFWSVYYLPGTTGWDEFTANTGAPAVLWNPQAQTRDGFFGVQNNKFGFNITGSSNLVIVVEACTNLANPVWSPLSTNTLNTFVGTNGTSYFSDPQWTNYPRRFYGFSWP
jgi:hypothetical protein